MVTSFKAQKTTVPADLVNIGAPVNPDFSERELLEREQHFLKDFPDDKACLDYLLHLRFGARIACPKCGRSGKFHKIRRIPAYACQWCGYHLHPMAQTDFARSRVGLRAWFRAIYLFSSVDGRISARQLQRWLGLSYKTAWRMRGVIADATHELPADWKADGRRGFDSLLAALITPRERNLTQVARSEPR